MVRQQTPQERKEAAETQARIDTPAIIAKVATERAKAKDGRLTLAPGIHYIESGSVMLAPGQVLISCDPPGVCSIEVPAGVGAVWNVAPQKDWDDAEAARI